MYEEKIKKLKKNKLKGAYLHLIATKRAPPNEKWQKETNHYKEVRLMNLKH